MRIGTHEFDVKNQTYIMGILNVTPDSFSDGGKFHGIDAALKRAEQMKREGAAILDIGGESTRPGYTPVSAEEEMERVLPVISAIKQVAKAAILEGADLINDIWGLKHDEDMASVIAQSQVACCLMHNRLDMEYKNFMTDLLADLEESVGIAHKAGIARDKIILDPGVGFAKNYEQNIEVLRHLDKVKTLGYPVLLGASRKSVIGLTLDLPSDKRLEGTLATTVAAVQMGYSFVRVHDIKENYRALQMAQAIYKRY